MIKFLINRPVAVFMISFAFILIGIVALLKIPTSLMPDIKIPEITIQISYFNNTARDLETNVVRPLKNNLIQVSNLKNIKTETREGNAIIKLFFEHGTDTDYAFIETNEKIDESLNSLPKDLERPKVVKASPSDIPILNLTVSLEENYSEAKFLELSDFCEKVLKKRIEQLPDVALADMSGQIKTEIIVSPFKNKLFSLGINNIDLIEQIRQNNIELGNLIIQNGIYHYNFNFLSQLHTKDDIENIYLNFKGRLFKLKDLAKVTVKSQESKGAIFNNGKRSIVFSIIKQTDSRVYEMKKSLDVLTNSFKNDYPKLNFSINQDQSKLLKLSIDNLKTSLMIGTVLAILIMFFFLNDFKSPLIIAISIPISIIISVFFMYILGLSINIISLSGLILGVGMMIDNSIIVIDNITQKLKTNKNVLIACIEGTNEIISPLIGSFLTTCSVFIPLIFLNGLTGELFFDQAIAISIGLASSLIVSIIIIPLIFKNLINTNFKFQNKINHTLIKFNKKNPYEFFYNYFFNRKWVIYSFSICFFLIGLFLLLNMEYSKLPLLKQTETIVLIDWNENITIDENQNRLQFITKQIPNIETVYTEIGEQDFLLNQDNFKDTSEALVYINTTSQLDFTKKQILSRVKEKFPNSKIYFESPNNIFQYIFGSKDGYLNAQVYSKLTIEVPIEKKLHNILKLLGDKTSTEIPLKKAISINLNNEKIVLYDVDYNDLIQELKTTFNVNYIDNLKTSQRYIPINLGYESSSFEDLISKLYVKNKNDIMIPIRELISIKENKQYKLITADAKGEYLSFEINSNKDYEDEVDLLKNKFSNNNDLGIRFTGSLNEISELKKEMIIVTIVAILLLYLIMAAQFESLWQPLIILLEIPIDIGGALFFLWIFGGTINIMSAIGIVVMSGIIINDSILKIYTINNLRKSGLSIPDAIKEGGKLRLKPILMTSLTTILALVPFLFISGLGAELQRPLALTVIGGMIIGTFISLYFVPLMYYTFSKK